MRRQLAAMGALAAAAALGPAGAPPASAGDDALVLYSAGLDRLLVDEKDQALLGALRLVDDRLAELPAELNRHDIPVPMIRLALDLLTSPLFLQAGTIEDADPAAGPPFYAQIVFTETKAGDAARFADRTGWMLQMMGLEPRGPMPGRPEISVFDAHGMPLYHGSAGPGEHVLALNRLDEGPRRAPDPGLPDGVEPVLAMAFNGPAAQPFVEMMLARMGPGGPPLREQLSMYGLAGPEASSFSGALGYAHDRAHGAWRYTNYVQVAQRWDSLVREPLTRRDMAMVPADATFAEVGRFRLSGLGEMLRMMAPELEGMEPHDDPFQVFTELTGLDLEQDLLAHLGQTYGFYASDSTGGGGLMSSVLFLEVTNAQALGESLGRLTGVINERSRLHARGYVQLRAFQREGVMLTTLTFPGLPIPLEISWTIHGGYLIAGAAPQAVIGAVRQAGGAGPSLANNASFRRMGGDAWQDALQVKFTDIPRLARSGYGLTQLLCAAIANGVRSPADPQRDPGLILPPYGELMDGASASVSIVRLDGNDLVGTIQSDRSLLVNLCGGLGMIGGSGSTIGVAALAGGILMPSLAKAQDNARAVKSAAQIRMLVVSMMAYAAEHDDASPPSIDALRPYIDRDRLTSPFGPVSDGRGDYWMNTDVERLAEIRFPDRRVAFYDRAMYEKGKHVTVGFFDGHVETMSTWELEMLIEEEPNAGTDFDLPDRR
jgi:prepilin-type processing-associated H-X9-DG protein